jgi:hypothetical protein
VEVSGQLHAPAALPAGENPLEPIGYEARKGTKREYKKKK